MPPAGRSLTPLRPPAQPACPCLRASAPAAPGSRNVLPPALRWGGGIRRGDSGYPAPRFKADGSPSQLSMACCCTLFLIDSNSAVSFPNHIIVPLKQVATLLCKTLVNVRFRNILNITRTARAAAAQAQGLPGPRREAGQPLGSQTNPVGPSTARFSSAAASWREATTVWTGAQVTLLGRSTREQGREIILPGTLRSPGRPFLSICFPGGLYS